MSPPTPRGWKWMRFKVPSNPNHSGIHDHQRVQPCQEQHPGEEFLCCSITPTPQTGRTTPLTPLSARSRPLTNRKNSRCHPHVMGKTNTTEQNEQRVWRCPEAQTKRQRQRCSAHRLNSGTVRKNASSAGGPKILAQSRISPRSWVVD